MRKFTKEHNELQWLFPTCDTEEQASKMFDVTTLNFQKNISRIYKITLLDMETIKLIGNILILAFLIFSLSMVLTAFIYKCNEIITQNPHKSEQVYVYPYYYRPYYRSY